MADPLPREHHRNVDAESPNPGLNRVPAKTPPIEARASDSLRWLASIVEFSDDAIIATDVNEVVMSWNRGAERMFGYTEAEAVGQPVQQLIHPLPGVLNEAHILERLLRGERVDHFEAQRRRRSGEVIDVSISASPVKDATGRIIGMAKILRDISERKRTDNVLRQGESRVRTAMAQVAETANRLELAIEAAKLGLWRWDATTDLVDLSVRAAEIFGLSPGPVITWADMQALLDEDDAERARLAVDRSVATRTDYSVEYRVIRSGGESVWVAATGRPMYEGGKIIGMLGFVQDVTDRRQHAELLERRIAERTAQLRETIGELEAFSYSVSHDMRTPLRAMQGYAERLMQEHGDRLDDEAKAYLVRINKNAQRLDLLIRDVLAYSRVAKSEISLQPLDLDVFVAGIVAQASDLQHNEVKVVVNRPLPRVLAHEAYLSQIFTNLLGNAVKFASPDRSPVITISAVADDSWVRVSVSDNGIGIAREHFDRIFEIFGRVYPDRQYEGTGIGLAIVKKAVQRMGGSITVASEPGQGSSFTFTLPRA